MGRSFQLVCIMVLVCLGFSTSLFAGSVGAAKSRVMQAQDYVDKGQKDNAQDKLNEAEKFLDGLTDAEKAPIEKDIAALRAKIGGGAAPALAAGPGPAASGTGGGDPEVAGRIERNITRYLTFGEGDAESSPSSASTSANQAADALNADDAKKNLSPETRQKLQARVDALQAKLKSGKGSKDARRFANRIESSVRAANESPRDTRFARTRLDEATALLGSDEARDKLDPATMQSLQEKLADGEAKYAGVIKKDALSHANANLDALDKRLVTDPFKETASDSAYKVTEELQALRQRTAYQLSRIPESDPDRKTAESRLATAQAKMKEYDDAWGAANVEAGIVNRWKYIAQGFEGWESESYAPSANAFEKPKLTKTEQAFRQSQVFLEEKQTVDAGKKHAVLPKAAAAIAEAQKTMAAAQAKLDSVFNQWMDAAEKQPRPQGPNRFDIGAAADMSRWAADRLAGSQYKEADVARANKLDKRWQDELAAIKQQHEETLRKMTAEANDAWPKIASSIDAQSGFNPTDVSSAKGKTFRFKGVRNRSGWDFDNRFELVIWVDGQPVAGTFEPKIRKEFADVARQTGDSVNDHIDWDVVAVVSGRGVVNQRFSSEVKDEHMNLLGKIEGTRPVDCVVVRVIAIHAGPIAMSAN